MDRLEPLPRSEYRSMIPLIIVAALLAIGFAFVWPW